MPEPLPPTLTELRNSVLIRTGFNATDGSAGGCFPLVEELLRRSQKELHLEAPWLRNWKRTSQTVTTDEHDYDLPDDALIGDMSRVAIADAEGKEYDLEYGSGSIRNITTTSGMPKWYEIQDNVIRLHPAPSADWPTLIYEYYEGPADLVADTDRPTIDGEAIIQRATYYLKRQTGFGGEWQPEREEHLRYLKRMQEEQGEIRAIDMRGSHARRYVRTIGDNAAWTTTWSPW